MPRAILCRRMRKRALFAVLTFEAYSCQSNRMAAFGKSNRTTSAPPKISSGPEMQNPNQNSMSTKGSKRTHICLTKGRLQPKSDLQGKTWRIQQGTFATFPANIHYWEHMMTSSEKCSSCMIMRDRPEKDVSNYPQASALRREAHAMMSRTPQRLLNILYVAVLSLLYLQVPSAAQDIPDWSGQWETFWRDGAALVELQQDGGRVFGTYEPGRGKIEAEVQGQILRGLWQVDGVEGKLTFAMSDDGGTFTGRFDTGEYWNGRRIDQQAADERQIGGDGTPRKTLQSIVASMNDFLIGNEVEALRFAQTLLVFAGENDESRSLNRRRALLFDVINLSTFRPYDAPPRPQSDTASFTIGLDGTKAIYDLRFVRTSLGAWRLLVEDEETLTATLQKYLEALRVSSVAAAQAAMARSPRGTMQQFLLGTYDWDGPGRAAAISTLDLSHLPEHLHESEGALLADYLKHVLDRAGFVFFQEIPNSPLRTTPYVHYVHPAGNIVISPVSAESDNQEIRWVFSSDTLRNVPELYSAMQHLPLADGIQQKAPLTQFFALRESLQEISPRLMSRAVLLENWQWLAILMLLIATIMLVFLLGRLASGAAVGTGAGGVGRGGSDNRGLVPAVQLTLGGLFLVWGFRTIGLLETPLAALHTIASVAAVIAGTWFLILLTGRVGTVFQKKAESTVGYSDEIVTAMTVGIIKLGVLVAGVLLLAETINLPYEGVLAGLGVGGLALAFAARETVSNVLGGILLLTDRPFRRGDLVETHGQLAMVETVGIRSTRLKRLDDTVMIIPNAKLTDQVIVNWGLRSRRRVDVSIGLTFDTPRELLEEFVQELRDLIIRQPQIDSEDIYVGLKDFDSSAIEIECRCFFRVLSYEEQVTARSTLVAEIVDLAKQNGVSFAFPTRTVHLIQEDH